MPDNHPKFELPSAIRGVLASVRRRIRAYVWGEGLAIVIATIGLMFWVGLAADWLFEPSVKTRQMAIAAAMVVLLVVAYRYLLRRAFVPISDATAALLLERRFPKLNEQLVTAVEAADSPARVAEFHPEFLGNTTRMANEAVASLPVGALFDRRPLVRATLLASAFVLSVVVFAIGSRDTFGFWLQRLALAEEPWPRRVQLEVVGFPPDAEGRRTHKLAQDDDLELLVHARTDGYEAPDEVEIRFRLADGRRGRDTLTRVGDATTQGDYQLFRYEFKHVAGNLDFDIVGGDDRVRDLHLQVVDRPELYALELESTYPEYLHRETRRLPVTGGMRVPEGTKLVLHASSTKPLTVARAHCAKTQQDVTVPFAGTASQKLLWDYGTFTSDDVLVVSVTDTDGVAAREAYRVSLAVVKDDVPQVAVRLAGIGSAITPEAILPMVGKVTDDYGLDRVWYDYQVDAGLLQQRPLTSQPNGEPSVDKLDAFDTRATNPQTGQRVMELKPKQRLTLALKATDRYNLSKEPRAGSSQQFTLDVVTVSELLALLERRELALRQRFESIYEKLTDTRNLLNRVRSNDTNADAVETASAAEAKKPNDPTAKPADAAVTAERMLARRRLRVAGSLQNVVQAADEVKGVAESFDDLGAELTNNRIENPDLKSRLGEQIARPLHQIAEQRLPELAAQLKLVESRLDDTTATATELKKAIAQADATLVAMRQVLDKMLELETYNEVVALLRGIITDQEEINRRTKERQKDKLKSVFE